MPATATVDSAGDLLEHIDHPPAREYITLLMQCADGGVTVGVLDDAVQARALSDWEAAALIGRDVTVGQVADIRETLCRTSPLVVRAGHRKGQPTYALNEKLR